MKIKSLYQIILTAALIPALNSCAGKDARAGKSETDHEYINSTANLKQSKEKLEESTAYEVYFTLDRTAECMSVSLETVNVPRKSTDEGIPKQSVFVVEKMIDFNTGSDKTRNTYILIGKNYNNRWEVHNPLKICGNTADPVAKLGGSVFRVRFTTFDSAPVYFTITLYTPANVSFSIDPAILQGAVPVK